MAQSFFHQRPLPISTPHQGTAEPPHVTAAQALVLDGQLKQVYRHTLHRSKQNTLRKVHFTLKSCISMHLRMYQCLYVSTYTVQNYFGWVVCIKLQILCGTKYNTYKMVFKRPVLHFIIAHNYTASIPTPTGYQQWVCCLCRRAACTNATPFSVLVSEQQRFHNRATHLSTSAAHHSPPQTLSLT